jgi:hypothetical protein
MSGAKIMNTRNTFFGLMLIGSISTLPVALASGYSSDSYANSDQSQMLKTSTEALSLEEETDLIFMREEEKMARDVYLFFSELWSNPVFSNIAESEQQHMDSMAVLLNTYGLTDPVQDDSIGLFTNPDLAELYITLTNRGQASVLEALKVGALIEEVDMRDIQHAIDQAEHADIIQTYENLLRGSRNHLRAFVRAIEEMGVVYEAQVLDQTEVDAIVDSPMERG